MDMIWIRMHRAHVWSRWQFPLLETPFDETTKWKYDMGRIPNGTGGNIPEAMSLWRVHMWFITKIRIWKKYIDGRTLGRLLTVHVYMYIYIFIRLNMIFMTACVLIFIIYIYIYIYVYDTNCNHNFLYLTSCWNKYLYGAGTRFSGSQ